MTQSWITEPTIARIKAMYRYVMPSFSGSGTSDLWNMISHKQANIHEALMADDDSLAELLDNPGSTYLYYGIDNIYPESMAGSRDSAEALEKKIAALLVVLADAIGATRYWNPAGGALFKNREPKQVQTIDEILSAIEKVVGTRLHFASPFPGEIGLLTSRGRITFRAVQALYQAYRIKTVAMKDHVRGMEIGGGSGRTAYFSSMLGMKDYTLVDLPMTLVAQAAFLSATLGPDAVWMAGEPESNQKGCIRLVPPSFVSKTSEKFDVVLNADSFTEMDQEHAQNYIDFASKNAAALVSINHEANKFTVAQISPKLACIRSPYWLRPGYVEEVYLFD